MDKQEFVRQAPIFYALAIVDSLQNISADFLTRRTIEERFTVGEFEDNLLLDQNLWDLAIEWSVQNGLVKVTRPAFGPTVFSPTDSIDGVLSRLYENEPTFEAYFEVGQSRDWLVLALQDIIDTAKMLGIEKSDYEFLDSWQPIAIETDVAATADLREDLEAAIDEIRKDNGYSASFPEERDYVLEGLNSFNKKLGEGRTTVGLVKSAMEKLTIVGRRFAGTAKEILITAAKQSLIEFVKQNGGELLRMLRHIIGI